MQTTVQRPAKRKLNRRPSKKAFNADMMVKLYELLQGQRDMVKVFSKALDSDIYFVNPASKNVDSKTLDGPMYSTREISFVLSLSPAELRRYHYLKMKLVQASALPEFLFKMFRQVLIFRKLAIWPFWAGVLFYNIGQIFMTARLKNYDFPTCLY